MDQDNFILNGNNPFASNMARMYACFVNGDLSGALSFFNEMAQSEAAEMYETEPDEEIASLAMEWAHSVDGKG